MCEKELKLSGKWFTRIERTLVAIGVVGFLVLLGGCHQPVKTETSEPTRPDYFERKGTCMELANRIYEQEVKDSTAGRERAVMLKPEYRYGVQLNTCLYAGGMFGGKVEQQWVRDGLTNMNIVSFVIFDGS